MSRQDMVSNGLDQWVMLVGLIFLITFHSYKFLVRTDDEGYEWFTYMSFSLYYIIVLLNAPGFGLVQMLTVIVAISYFGVMTRKMVLGFKHKSVTQKAIELILLLLLMGAVVAANANILVAVVYAAVMLCVVVSVHLLKRELTLQLNKPLILNVTAFSFLMLGLYSPWIALITLMIYFAILFYYDSERWFLAYVIPFGVVALLLIGNIL